LEIVGALHGHSRYSDGRGTVEEIWEAAQEAHLDFLVLTDHDTLAPLEDVGEAFQGSTLMLFGCEVSPPTNHLLVFGATRCPDRSQAPQVYVDDARAQGALTFLAHPHDRGVPLARIPSYRWDAWPLEGFTGLEIWNQLSDWSGHLKGLGSAVQALRRPAAHLAGPEPQTLSLWDALGQERKVVGIAGLDVHDVQVGRGPLVAHIFPYAYAMRTLLCYVDVEAWSRDVAEAKGSLLAALGAGRLHFANAELADARNLTFQAERRDAPPARLGDEVPWHSALALHLASPVAADLAILKDGRPIAQAFGDRLSAPVDGPGVYRAELRLPCGGRLLPWAFTNPIYLRPEGFASR